MPFAIVRNDITAMEVDAVVNTANPRPVIGSGVDGAIHQAAGPELLTAREKIGRIGVGEAAITPGFHLRARYGRADGQERPGFCAAATTLPLRWPPGQAANPSPFPWFLPEITVSPRTGPCKSRWTPSKAF